MAYLLHQLLTESATRLPDKEAVRFSGKSLSYSQLDRVTNQLARKLCELGVRRGDRVGIFVHKSLASVVAVSGIMKAGGVYVPLDPGAPAKRLAYITRNCGIRVLLTSSEKLKTVSQFFDEGTPVEALVLMNEGERASISQETRATIVSWHEVRAQDDGRFAAILASGNSEQKRDALAQLRLQDSEASSRIAAAALSDADELVRAAAIGAIATAAAFTTVIL
ncbi:MAG TPA: AMP-binding protein, partial [Acidobacteriota bacterium]|nr:AMP-binding protein [Acidobacteriota bacterium]